MLNWHFIPRTNLHLGVYNNEYLYVLLDLASKT